MIDSNGKKTKMNSLTSDKSKKKRVCHLTKMAEISAICYISLEKTFEIRYQFILEKKLRQHAATYPFWIVFLSGNVPSIFILMLVLVRCVCVCLHHVFYVFVFLLVYVTFRFYFFLYFSVVQMNFCSVQWLICLSRSKFVNDFNQIYCRM